MLSFQNLSIRRKQMLIIMLTSSVALLLACAAFVAYDTVTFRQELSGQVTILADAVGNNCVAAIDFDDPKAAGETLAALRANDNIVSACVYSRDGQVFATYQREGASSFVPPAVRPAGQEFTRDELHLFRVIRQGGAMTGTIFVASDLKSLSSQLKNYASIVAMVFLTSLLATLLLSSRLQRVVSDPILHLARVARSVALDKNYTVRATRKGDDELGRLIDSFNEMLDQIQQRDAALLAARDNLENRVKARTSELAESLSVLNATLESTADGILVVNNQGKMNFQNQRFAELWKIPPHIAESNDDDAAVRYVMNMTIEPERFKEKVVHYYSHPDERGWDEIELKNGTIMERITGPVLGRDGGNYGRIWTFRDVTQSRRDQAALKESEANFYSLVDQMPAGIFRKDKEGRYVFVNSWFCRIRNAKPEDYLGKLPQEIAAAVRGSGAQASDAVKLFAAGLEDHSSILKNGRQIEVDEEYHLPDGGIIYHHVVKSPVFDPDGAVIGSQGILLDITQRKQAEAALRDNEAFLNTVIENIPHMIFIKDAKDLRFVKFNKAGQELLGYSLAELIGKNDYDFFPKELADHFTENDREVLRGRAGVDIPEESVQTRHQGERVLHTKKIPIFDSAGRLLYLLGISEDITERKRAEAELAYERDLLRALMENSPDHIYFKDAQSRFIKSSSAQARQFGVASPSELAGKTDFDFFSEKRARAAFEDEQEIIRTGQPIIGKMEREIWTDGRGESWALTTKMPLRNKDGEIIGTFGISKDITALKQTESELSYERDLLRTLLESSPDKIYFKDAQSRFIKASNAQARQFGVASTDEMVGKTDFDFFTEEHARPAFEDEQAIIRTGEPMIGKIEREILKDGHGETWVLTTKMPLRNKDGEIIGTFGISKDITAIKETEAKLEVAHRQLLETSRQAGMAEVATNVLHNVGNVLNSVNVSAALVVDNTKKSKVPYLGKAAALLNEHAADLGDFMSRDPKGQQLPGYLTQLAEQLAREQQNAITELELLRQNIEHIKDIVAMQQNYAKISGVTETINLTHLVEDAVRMNAGALARHEVELVREYNDVPPITVDKHRVLQILINLIRNAKYACDDSGRKDKQLKLQVSRTDTGVRIAVIDNGIGIPPENLPRIFNHGFTTRKKGHGFGLHSGALAARELGGALTVESRGVGHGATFVLELPTLPISPPV